MRRLTLRHREVLTLISQGLRTWEIANALGIHRLGIRGIAGLVRYAIWTGLVPVEPAEASSLVGAAGGEA